jgi:hypothetical protein
MSAMTTFLVDANILVEAYKRYYSFDIVPSFWRKLKSKADQGIVLSVDRIQHEINKYGEEDELKNWVNSEFCDCFIPSGDVNVINAYREVITWATSQTQYTPAAQSEFASVGDSWLIACAKAHNYVLVTHEVFDPNVRRRIPIPNVCRGLNVEYINTFNMLRRLGIKLG